MKKDITIPKVEEVTIAIAKHEPEQDGPAWRVYLINGNDYAIQNTLVTSKGYGTKDGEKQETSTLRHYLETVPPHSSVLVEPIDPALFHLNNEYWVSYYVGREIFDKKYIFVPESIQEDNTTFIKELAMEGILHS